MSSICVIDYGSFQLRAGFSGQKIPQIIYPSCAGVVNNSTKCFGREVTDKLREKELIDLEYIYKNASVTDWDNWETLLKTTFTDMSVDPTDCGVFLTKHHLAYKMDCEKKIQLLFETFEVPHAYLSTSNGIGLFSNGLSTGFVLESGASGSSGLAIFEGRAIKKGFRIPLGGDTVDGYLKQLLTELNVYCETNLDMETVRDIKHSFGFVAKDLSKEMENYTNYTTGYVDYTLLDGKVITMKNQRFRCGESLFQPNVTGMGIKGFPFQVAETISSCDIDIRATLYKNIVFCGGNTKFKGFMERFIDEFGSQTTSKIKPVVKFQEGQELSVWKGGSMFSSLDTYKSLWISKDEYDEFGPGLQDTRCF